MSYHPETTTFWGSPWQPHGRRVGGYVEGHNNTRQGRETLLEVPVPTTSQVRDHSPGYMEQKNRPSEPCPNSWPTESLGIKCHYCLKPLNVGVICYATRDNWNNAPLQHLKDCSIVHPILKQNTPQFFNPTFATSYWLVSITTAVFCYST